MQQKTHIALAGILLFLILLTGPAAAAGTIQLDIPEGPVAVGDITEWTLSLIGASNMKSCVLDLGISGTGSGTIALEEGTLGGSYTLNPDTGRIAWQSATSVTAGTIAKIRFTAEKAGPVVISVTADEITERDTLDQNVKDRYTLSGGNLRISGGKSIRLDLPAAPLTVGAPTGLPIIISGAENLKGAAITLKTPAGSGDATFSLQKGNLSDTGYQNFPIALSADGTAKIIWTDAYSHQGEPILLATLWCTPHTAGSIPLTITVDEIIERDSGDTTAEYAVSGGPIPVAGASVITVTDGILAVPNKATLIPVTVSGANNMKLARIEVAVTENGANAKFELVRGDVSTQTFDVTSPAGPNNYIGRIDWTSSQSVTDGVLFYLKVTPSSSGNFPVSLNIVEIQERGTEGSGQDLIDATDRYTAVGGTVLGSFMTKLSDNTVPPVGGFVAGDGLWSAATPARLVFNSSPEGLTVAAPQITWGGNSAPVNETLIVEETSDGTVWTEIFRGRPPTDATGRIVIPPAEKPDAAELKITFDGRRLGDVNGDARITVLDSQKVMDYRIATIALSPLERLYADVNGDGRITVSDSQKIMDYRIAKVNEHYL